MSNHSYLQNSQTFCSSFGFDRTLTYNMCGRRLYTYSMKKLKTHTVHLYNIVSESKKLYLFFIFRRVYSKILPALVRYAPYAQYLPMKWRETHRIWRFSQRLIYILLLFFVCSRNTFFFLPTTTPARVVFIQTHPHLTDCVDR